MGPKLSEDVSLRASIAALSSFFVGQATMAETLQHVSELAVASLKPVEFAGLTMLVDGRPMTAVFTNPESPEVDQAQYTSGKGPCLDAFRTGKIHTISSMADDNPWPEFVAACRAHGILSTLSLPIWAAGMPLGALNLYSKVQHSFNEAEIEAATLFASQASIVLANAQAYWDARVLSEQLGESLASRAVIEQAKGIIMASLRCSADEAFNYLVKQSQATNIKLRAVAQDIVDDTTRRPTPPS